MSAKKKRGDRRGSRTHYTHSYLYKAADSAYEKGVTNPEGSFYQFMLSQVACAFAIEAFLNHVGRRHVSDWEPSQDEWLDPKRKLKRVAVAIGLELDTRGSMYRDYVQLTHFRNTLAHGRVEQVSGHWQSKDEGTSGGEALDAGWMKSCKATVARRHLDRIRELAGVIYTAAGEREQPFLTLAEGESSSN